MPMVTSKLRGKLEILQELIVDAYIEGIETGGLHPRDFAPVVTLLNHNKVVTTAEEVEGTHSKIKKLVKKK